MCWKIGNDQCHCLTFLSVLGLLQLLVGIPITVLSFLVFFQTDLGYLLSPFWCGISVSPGLDILSSFVASNWVASRARRTEH